MGSKQPLSRSGCASGAGAARASRSSSDRSSGQLHVDRRARRHGTGTRPTLRRGDSSRYQPEEDRRDEHPQDRAADELHDQPGDELVGERARSPRSAGTSRTPGTAGGRRTSGTTRGSSERATAGTGRASARARERRVLRQRRHHRPPHHERGRDQQDVQSEVRPLEPTESATTAGQCTNNRTELKRISATMGLRQEAERRPRRASGRRNRRRSHGGIPAISNAGATSVNSMCCSMWTWYR